MHFGAWGTGADPVLKLMTAWHPGGGESQAERSETPVEEAARGWAAAGNGVDWIEEALARIERSAGADELEALRVELLGRNGRVTQGLRGLGRLDPEARRAEGRRWNEARARIEEALSRRRAVVAELAARAALGPPVDVTLPAEPVPRGRPSPVRLAQELLEDIFARMGFSVADGPEVETDHYNFEALHIPVDHPARDMQDSFYLFGDLLLRTQTSPMQIRSMRAMAPALPVRLIAPGRVYRRDNDATHSPVFHQVEGLVVDRGIALSDLKGTLLVALGAFFGEEVRLRLRPSYFPFTEPSAEVDMHCGFCGGSGCATCKGTGWIELLGAGMVHPEVLRNGGYDPDEVTGFAFGLGIERAAMLRFGVHDLRSFYLNDLRVRRPVGEAP